MAAADPSPLWPLYRRAGEVEELVRECETLNDAARCIADIENLDVKSLTFEVSVPIRIPDSASPLPEFTYRGKRGTFLVRWPAR